MPFKFLFFLVAALTSCAAVSALGINCRGAHYCDKFDNGSHQHYKVKILDQISSQIVTIDDNRLYQNGQHIVCVDGVAHFSIGAGFVDDEGSICVFLQKTLNGALGRDIKMMVAKLQLHGCKACGSVPSTNMLGNGDVKNGMLTVNWVNRVTIDDGPCRNGLMEMCSYDIRDYGMGIVKDAP